MKVMNFDDKEIQATRQTLFHAVLVTPDDAVPIESTKQRKRPLSQARSSGTAGVVNAENNEVAVTMLLLDRPNSNKRRRRKSVEVSPCAAVDNGSMR